MLRSRSFGFKVAIGFGFLFFMLLTIETIGYVSISRLWNNTNQLRNSYAKIGQLSALMSMMKDAEAGQRGYLLTGDGIYLEPYKEAQVSVYKIIEQLRDSTAADPVLASLLDQAAGLVQAKMAELKQTIDM